MQGVHHTYKSDYPNQVHQLNYSISQNYYLLKNGEIKYQAKKFDVNLSNYTKTGKRHLYSFLIRDHFSNCFYAELHPIDEAHNIKEFLFNAWKHKKDFEFRGIPRSLIIGRHVAEKFPFINNLEKNIGLNIELAKNGFATGIRSLRDWENNIKYFTYFEGYKTIAEFQNHTELMCRDINCRESGKTEQNLLKWANNKPSGKVINDRIEFERFFE